MSIKVTTVPIRIDNDLVERCLKGDQAAWQALVTRYQRLVYSVAHTLCPQSDDVSDVFQQVWMELYQHLANVRNIEALPAWLLRFPVSRAVGLLVRWQIRLRRSVQISQQTASAALTTWG